MPDLTIPLGEPATIAAIDLWPVVSGTPPQFVGTGAPTGMGFSTDKKVLSGTPTVAESKFVDAGYQVGGSFVYANEGLYLHVEEMAPPGPSYLHAPVGMRLDDTLDIVKSSDGAHVIGADAHVGSAVVGMKFSDDYARWVASEELRALIAPYDVDHLSHAIMWRGERYRIDGPPLVFRRHGQDHHLTLKLKQPDAV